jgi:hypothetical protein
VLGLEDTADGSVMDGHLSAGIRAVDAVFAGIG